MKNKLPVIFSDLGMFGFQNYVLALISIAGDKLGSWDMKIEFINGSLSSPPFLSEASC